MDRLPREGWEALAAADWPTARRWFEQARAQAETAEVLDGLSQAAHFEGEYDSAIELKERAFAAYRREGRPADAANTARWLAFLHGTFHGNFGRERMDGARRAPARGSGGVRRARLADPGPGAVLARQVEREKCAASALAIARRFGDADLEFEALALLGETYVATGRVAEGMKLLDEAMAAVSAGEVASHGAVGEIYCRLLSACEHATDVRRAEEWMALVDRTSRGPSFVRPTCRTHYGGILIALGRWTEAEAELLDAIQAFERGYRGDRVYPLVRLADLRVRQGRYRGGGAPAWRAWSGTRPPGARRRRSRWRAATSARRRSSRGSASRAATRPTRRARRCWSCS